MLLLGLSGKACGDRGGSAQLFVVVVCSMKGILSFLLWQQMEEIWREMRWMMDALQHARYKQPSCGLSLNGFLSTSSGTAKEKTRSSSSHLDFLPSPAPSPDSSRKLSSGKGLAPHGSTTPQTPSGQQPLCASPADLHGLSDEEGSSEVFLATDSDYDSSRAQSPKELDLVSVGPECCGRRAARSLRDSAPDVLQSHELQPAPLAPPEPRPPPELYDSDFVLPSRQIELLRVTEKRQAYCVRTSSLDFPKPLCPVARKSCPGSVDSSPTESRAGGHGSQGRPGTVSTHSPERGRTRSAEWTPSSQELPEQPGGKKPGSVTLRVCPQYETGLSKETSVKVPAPTEGSGAAVPCPGRMGEDGTTGTRGPRLALPSASSAVPGVPRLLPASYPPLLLGGGPRSPGSSAHTAESLGWAVRDLRGEGSEVVPRRAPRPLLLCSVHACVPSEVQEGLCPSAGLCLAQFPAGRGADGSSGSRVLFTQRGW